MYCWLARRRLLGHCAGLCVQALGGNPKMAWLSFSEESALEVSVTQHALYKSTSYLTFIMAEPAQEFTQLT